MVSIKYALNSKGTVHNIFVTKGSSIGGVINFSASVSNGNISPKVPNISVVHDKVEKEQITRATAINTEISLKGKKVSAEELGFNTDKEKSQEVTKDNEKHLNADLHTDLANKENRDSIDKKTGERRTEKIYLSIYDLNDPKKSFAKLFGHKKGHLATYDRDENTAEKIESKVSKEDKTRVFNSKEKDEYIKFLKENYKSKSLNEQFIEAKAIPKDERENDGVSMSTGFSAFAGPGISLETSLTVMRDSKLKEMYISLSQTEGAGFGIPSFDTGGVSFSYLLFAEQPDDLTGASFEIAGSIRVGNYGIEAGGEMSLETGKFESVSASVGKKVGLAGKQFVDKYGTGLKAGEVHMQVKFTKNIFSIKLPSIYTKNIRTIENKIGSIEKQIENSNSYFEKAYLETEKYKYEVRKIQEMTKILIDYSIKNKDFLEKKLEDYKRDYFQNRYEYYKLNREVD